MGEEGEREGGESEERAACILTSGAAALVEVALSDFSSLACAHMYRNNLTPPTPTCYTVHDVAVNIRVRRAPLLHTRFPFVVHYFAFFLLSFSSPTGASAPAAWSLLPNRAIDGDPLPPPIKEPLLSSPVSLQRCLHPFTHIMLSPT